MSFDRHYPNRKDKRKPYHKGGRVDRSCRPGGSCPYCLSSRLRWRRLAEIRTREQVA